MRETHVSIENYHQMHDNCTRGMGKISKLALNSFREKLTKKIHLFRAKRLNAIDINQNNQLKLLKITNVDVSLLFDVA